VVLHTKEYLAAVIPSKQGLVLNTLRWASEIREPAELKLPAGGKKALKDSDMKMARQLIADMTAGWQPDAYADKFTQAIHALVAKRQKSGATEQVESMEAAEQPASNVLDLTALLAQSLKRKGGGSEKNSPTPGRIAAGKTAPRRA
jgi:DNA end-binding protein Ku